jgi:hypothetical protein
MEKTKKTPPGNATATTSRQPTIKTKQPPSRAGLYATEVAGGSNAQDVKGAKCADIRKAVEVVSHRSSPRKRRRRKESCFPAGPSPLTWAREGVTHEEPGQRWRCSIEPPRKPATAIGQKFTQRRKAAHQANGGLNEQAQNKVTSRTLLTTEITKKPNRQQPSHHGKAVPHIQKRRMLVSTSQLVPAGFYLTAGPRRLSKLIGFIGRSLRPRWFGPHSWSTTFTHGDWLHRP